MENDDLEGLSQTQTEKVLQFQDLIGIDDITQCRDILTRHQWDLEVAIQEQLNLREGRPSMYASSMDNHREPQVINDRYLQRIFVNSRVPVPAHGFTGFIGFFFNYVFSICYNTVTSIFSVLRDLLRGNERSKFRFNPSIHMICDSNKLNSFAICACVFIQQLLQTH